MRAKKQFLPLKEILERVANTRNSNMFIPRDAANYEANLVKCILDNNSTLVMRHNRDLLLRRSYLTRIKAYAPYAHADAVPLEKSERWLK